MLDAGWRRLKPESPKHRAVAVWFGGGGGRIPARPERQQTADPQRRVARGVGSRPIRDGTSRRAFKERLLSGGYSPGTLCEGTLRGGGSAAADAGSLETVQCGKPGQTPSGLPVSAAPASPSARRRFPSRAPPGNRASLYGQVVPSPW